MDLLQFFEELKDRVCIRQWDKADREHLFRIIREVYEADGAFSPNEHAHFRNHLLAMGISKDALDEDFQTAMVALRDDAEKMKIVYFWMASALYADDDFDQQEQAFIDRIVTKYDLNETALRTAIDQVRGRKLDAAIREWFQKYVE